MKLQTQVVDNFLSKEDFKTIESLVNTRLLWQFEKNIAYEKEDKDYKTFYMYHLFHPQAYEFEEIKSNDHLRPLYYKINSHLSETNYSKIILEGSNESLNYFDSPVGTNLIRVKANLYPRTEQIIEHEFHSDAPKNNKTSLCACLFSINTCDGYTLFETGEKIYSVKNRAVFFDSGLNTHASTTCTNNVVRFNINICWST
jgi:hypothetical protein